MNFDFSDEQKQLRDEARRFLSENSSPKHVRAILEGKDTYDRALWKGLAELGLIGVAIPEEFGGAGAGRLELCVVAEELGRALAPVPYSSTVYLAAELLMLAGTDAQKQAWLPKIASGESLIAFGLSEKTAGSDAGSMRSQAVETGDHYVINGRKWFTSGAMNEDCKILIVMGKTDPDNPDKHKQQSMILVPKDTPCVKIIRDLKVYGYDHAPVGHPEIVYDNVRVPASNMLLGEGRGFEIAQGRLGPGRIHHCMRLIGCAQRALELMCQRANKRVAFGKPLGEQGSVREDIANSYCEIEQARLLTLKAADKMDREGNKAARDLIAAAKIVVPSMAARVIDRAIQIHGGMGVSQDTFLAESYTYARFIRIGDGPDQVHMSQLGRTLLKKYA